MYRLTLLAALTLSLTACGGSNATAPAQAPAKAPAAEVAAPAEPTAVPATEAPKGVTMAMYTELKNGMTEDEVKATLGGGAMCQEMSSSELAGIKTVSWQCTGAEFASNAILMLQDGKLMSKSQFGLK